MSVSISRADVVAALRERRRLSVSGAIECDNVEAIAMRDALDLYLNVAGASGAVWADPSGGRSPVGNPAVAGARLAADPLLMPWLLARHLPKLARIGRPLADADLSGATSPVLFLRTDHWFNLTSGGSVGHLKGVIDNLRALGRETHVVSTDRLTGIAVDDHFHLCAPVYGLGRNLPQLPELEYNRQLLRFVAGRWADWQPRLVYQRLGLMSYAGAWLKARYGVPFICEYNGNLAWVARNWGRGPLFLERLANSIEALSLRAADVVVVISEAVGDEAESRGVPRERILVNPNGVDPEAFRPDLDATEIRGRYGLGQATVLGFIGTFGLWHGAELLAEAFARLCRQRPDLGARVKLLMIGDGERHRQTLAIIRDAGLMERVVFTGRVPQADAPRYLAACDIFVSPHVPNSTGTPFFGSPTKLFEYMAMGRGIVASDLDQIGKVLSHGRTAWLVQPGSAAGLAAGLEKLIDDPVTRTKLGAAAREEAVRRYTWRAHTARILEKLEERRR